jgi:hypothetical protein
MESRREIMLANAKVVISENADTAKKRFKKESSLAGDKLKHHAQEASSKAKETVENKAREIVSGLNQLESEIANHYLDNMKYGMAGM